MEQSQEALGSSSVSLAVVMFSHTLFHGDVGVCFLLGESNSRGQNAMVTSLDALNTSGLEAELKKKKDMVNSSSEIPTAVLGTETDGEQCVGLPPSLLSSKLGGAPESHWNCHS